jgi:hypothetical protein
LSCLEMWWVRVKNLGKQRRAGDKQALMLASGAVRQERGNVLLGIESYLYDHQPHTQKWTLKVGGRWGEKQGITPGWHVMQLC